MIILLLIVFICPLTSVNAGFNCKTIANWFHKHLFSLIFPINLLFSCFFFSWYPLNKRPVFFWRLKRKKKGGGKTVKDLRCKSVMNARLYHQSRDTIYSRDTINPRLRLETISLSTQFVDEIASLLAFLKLVRVNSCFFRIISFEAKKQEQEPSRKKVNSSPVDSSSAITI